LAAIGSRIRALRVEKGLSQALLAEKAQLSLPHVGALERGQSNPGAATLMKLAVALDVEVSALFPLLFELGGIWSALEPEGREQVEDVSGDTESLLSSALVAQMVNVEPRTIQKWIHDGLLTPFAYVQSSQKQRYAAFRREDLPRVIEVRNRASVRPKRADKQK
jgi:transcriptional regulator with XRE-family HTH domain